MLDLIKHLSLKNAGYLAIAMTACTILLHILLIVKVFPYQLANGGRSESFESASKQSMLSIVLLLFMIVYLLFTSKILPFAPSGILLKLVIITIWIAVILLVVSTIMQLLGTGFEKCVTSIMSFLTLISVIRIAVEYSFK